jgi:phosphoribosyl-ATP pyrophosphohydrolase/phosphoribosyl-AMP cyclohydrolase
MKIGERDIDFSKNPDGLVPAIVQDAVTRKVLMLGYMNEQSLKMTLSGKRVTFYSRSRQKLWTKGETSGNYLDLREVKVDCDGDTLLVSAIPAGPVCHLGDDTCFAEDNDPLTHEGLDFLAYLEQVIQERRDFPVDGSYTNLLFSKGVNKIAQKVGEEAVELVIEAKDDHKRLFLGEAADLVYHVLVLLAHKGYTLEEVLEVLKSRHSR